MGKSIIFDEFNPILRGIKSNLFYAGGGGAYMPPLWFLGKKSFLPNSFCTLKQLPKIGLHTKNQVSTSKNKKMSAVLKSPSVIWPEEFCQYFAFFTSSH